jgi:hypothetical protein
MEAAEVELLITEKRTPQRVFVTAVDGRSVATIVMG